MSATVRILDYQPQHQPTFRALNEEWITRYFRMEQPDYDMLDQPPSSTFWRQAGLF